MRIGAEGKLDGRQCFSVPNEEKGERRKEKRGEGVRERARRCEGNIWERERFDHVDAADSWAKEGDAKRLHNRPCGRSLGEGRPGRKCLRSIPGDGRRGGERCAAPQGACGLVGPTGGGGGRSKGTALVEGHSDRQKGKRGKERSGWGSAGPRHLAGRRWSVEASHHRPIIRGNVQEKPDARAVGILGAGVRGRSSAYRSLDGGRAHRRPDSI